MAVSTTWGNVKQTINDEMLCEIVANKSLFMRELLQKGPQQLHLADQDLVNISSASFFQLSFENEFAQLRYHFNERLFQWLQIWYFQSIQDLSEAFIVLQNSCFILFSYLLNIEC